LVQNDGRRLAVSVVGVGVAAVHAVFPSVVPDAIGAAFLLFAAVPWLSWLLKSLEVTGIGKVEFRELQRETEEAKGAAESARTDSAPA
jgi:hypothetical protein